MYEMPDNTYNKVFVYVNTYLTQGLRVCEMPDNTYNARSSCIKCQIILITQGLRVCEMPDNTYNARSSCM